MDYYMKDARLMESFTLDGHCYDAYIIDYSDDEYSVIIYYTDGELESVRFVN